MSCEKYIGYLERDIADTMWPSGLCRESVREPSQGACPGEDSKNRSTHYST